jgi:hypothetical protein
MIRIIYLSVFILILLSCVEPFEIKDTGNTQMLVVEAVLSNQLKKHQVFLSRTTALNDRNYLRERGATVSISASDGTSISLTESGPGVYETVEFSAQAEKKYLLHIKTADGKEYSSSEVPFKDGADIGEVYGKYVDNPNGGGKGIQIYTDTEDPSGNTRYYRWNYIETYQVNAPFPSVWVWLGGNEVTFRVDGIDTCYVTDTLRNVLIRTTKDLEQDKVTAQQLRYIPETSYIMRFRYSILVQQFCLSEESYLYWDNLRVISEQQGSLSDQQPGSLSGNIYSTTDPNETVLGYFEVCRVSEKRIFLKAIDFYNDGFKRPPNFRSSCYEIEPILVPVLQLGEKMEKYQHSMYIWEAYGDYPSTVFELMPKTCCDCRDQGPTEKPPFF